jgi:hypothetical protein
VVSLYVTKQIIKRKDNMAVLRCSKTALRKVNKIVKQRRKGSLILHTQQSVVEDAVNTLEEKEKKN